MSRIHAEVLADAVHEQGHLIRDLADVGLRGAEDTQTAAGARRGDEEHRVVELDHRLAHLARTKMASGTLGEAVQT